MNKPSPILWVAFLLILLLPTTAGRLLLDITGGLLILILISPILLGVAGWIGWKVIQSQMTTCNSCGTSLIGSQEYCPVCNSEVNSRDNKQQNINIPASSATIDITPKDVD